MGGIRRRAKAVSKGNDMREAKAKGREGASAKAVDVMGGELLPDEDYKNNFEDSEQ